MRALFLSDLLPQAVYEIKGDALHHLVNVVRVETGEKLLLLNGKGLIVETTVESISKKNLFLKMISEKTETRNFSYDLALGMPKREALELCLKEATELGFRHIFLIRSSYSQMRFPETERVQNLLVSALEQSNAPFLPVVEMVDWKEIAWDKYGEVLMLDSQTKSSSTGTASGQKDKILVVGPEGGFSPEELGYLHSLPMTKVVNLPTPILRSPTAVATGAGLLIQSLLK